MAAAAAAAAAGPRRIVRGYGLIEELKTHKPAKVVAWGEDGEIIARINVPDVHNRHARVIAALDGIDWIACDLLDKKDGLLFRHKRNADDRAPAGHLEELPSTRNVAELQGYVAIFLRAVDGVLSRYERGLQNVLDVQRSLVEHATRRLEASEARLAREMSLNHQLSGELLAAQIGAQLQLGEGEDGEQTQAGTALGNLVPLIIKAAMQQPAQHAEKEKGAPTKGAPKNGHSKPATKPERQSAAKPADAAPSGD